MRLPHFLFLLSTIILFYSCADSGKTIVENPIVPVEIDSTAIKARIQFEKDSTLTAFVLEQLIDDLISEESPNSLYGEELFSDVMLPELYQSHSYQLLWKDSLKRSTAIKALEDSRSDGLVPDDYHLKAISAILETGQDDYESNSALDILITDGIILYGTHLLNGKTDPKTLEPNLAIEDRSLSDSELDVMRTMLIEGDVPSIIEMLRPPSDYYRSMMDGLEFYTSLADSGAWKVTSINERKLEPDSTYKDIPPIRARMLIEGDLTLTSDTSIVDSLLMSERYDMDLQRAIERFQERHGLNPDGVIGRGTVRAMNISVDEKINLLKANLERARWIHHDLDSNFVLVNIAGFDLRLVKGDTLCWTTKVMVGKVATATPVFRDEIEFVEINPDWTVPFSISNDEILPKLKKDPSYLSRNNMELLNMSGNKTDASAVDFNSYEEKMPFIVRQGPGNGNSLGRVKFLFPNQFRVYLHDTPSKSLFAREKRAFSHGCIRVEDPFKFAELLLAEQGITRHYIDSVLTDRKKYRIVLEEPLPVLITYSTAFADHDMVYFYEDVYARDQALMKALEL